jgi:hypothetical protein
MTSGTRLSPLAPYHAGGGGGIAIPPAAWHDSTYTDATLSTQCVVPPTPGPLAGHLQPTWHTSAHANTFRGTAQRD